jgi:hypothetical protein
MSSFHNLLCFGEPEDVARFLDTTTNSLDESEIIAALHNAFTRIARLEEDLSILKARAARDVTGPDDESEADK